MKINDYLKSLGPDAETVARNLRLQGVSGQRRSSNTCPIVVAVNRNCKPWPGLRAPRPGVLTYNDDQIIDPAVPAPVAEFMAGFDDGRWSELLPTF